MARDNSPIVKQSRREGYALAPKAHKIMAKKSGIPGEHGDARVRLPRGEDHDGFDVGAFHGLAIVERPVRAETLNLGALVACPFDAILVVVTHDGDLDVRHVEQCAHLAESAAADADDGDPDFTSGNTHFLHSCP